MLGLKLHRRENAVSQAEFARSKRMMWLIALVWTGALVTAIMIINSDEWYFILGVVLVFGLTVPAPGELFQSYEGYKKKWLRHGGASRGERIARLHG